MFFNFCSMIIRLILSHCQCKMFLQEPRRLHHRGHMQYPEPTEMNGIISQLRRRMTNRASPTSAQLSSVLTALPLRHHPRDRLTWTSLSSRNRLYFHHPRCRCTTLKLGDAFPVPSASCIPPGCEMVQKSVNQEHWSQSGFMSNKRHGEGN